MTNPQRNTSERDGPRIGARGAWVLAGLVGIFLCFPPAAFAYLDPSTGSMVVSAIVGIFASIALAVKTYWYKIKGFFRRGGQGGKQQASSRKRTNRP